VIMHPTMRRLVCLSVMTGAVVTAACKGGERSSAVPPAGGPDTAAPGVVLAHYTGNADSARKGRALFVRYNCYGCHGGLAGGAMGPSLRDTIWKYGGSDSSIFLSIEQGRPLGMPTWGGIIPPAEIHLLVDYIKSLRTDAEPKFFFVQIDSNGTVVAPAGDSVTATVR